MDNLDSIPWLIPILVVFSLVLLSSIFWFPGFRKQQSSVQQPVPKPLVKEDPGRKTEDHLEITIEVWQRDEFLKTPGHIESCGYDLRWAMGEGSMETFFSLKKLGANRYVRLEYVAFVLESGDRIPCSVRGERLFLAPDGFHFEHREKLVMIYVIPLAD